jgi:hypothetical protein
MLNASATLSTSGGVVATFTIANGGTGYTALDVLTLTGGTGTATIRVDTVDGSGVVLTATLLTGGGGYTVATVNTTVAPAGGAGCTIAIATITGSWKKVEAAYLALDHIDNDYYDVNTPRTSNAFTTAAVNLQGVMVNIMRSGSTGTVTIQLMEGATERATTGAVNVSTIPVGRPWHYLTFTTPYAASAATNYTIKMTASTAARVYWSTDSGGTRFM